MSEEYNIKESIPRVGYLYPVLQDAYGNTIDGVHRLQQDPNWPVKKLEHITDPVQLAIARLTANVCRRDVPAEEKMKWLRQIASMTGWSPKEIAEHLPVSYSWVMKYLPDEFKEEIRAEAGRLGGEARAEDFATRRVAKESEETRKPIQWVPCEGEGCNILTKATPEHIHEGKVLCSSCLRKAGATAEPPRKTARSLELPPEPEMEEGREEPQGPGSPEIDEGSEEPEEPEMKWRSTITMKKPHTVDWPIKPDEDEVLGELADAVRSGDIDSLFEITIQEISE